MDAIFRKISYYKTNKDINYINKKISEARLNATKTKSPFVRYLINRDANRWEKNLQIALDEFEERRSQKA